MFQDAVLIACLLSLNQGQSHPQAPTLKHKLTPQLAKEVHVNDITFTTALPNFHGPARKAPNHLNAIKHESPYKSGRRTGKLTENPLRISHKYVATPERHHGTNRLKLSSSSLHYKKSKPYDGYVEIMHGSYFEPEMVLPPPIASLSATGITQSMNEYSSKNHPTSPVPPVLRPTGTQGQNMKKFVPSLPLHSSEQSDEKPDSRSKYNDFKPLPIDHMDSDREKMGKNLGKSKKEPPLSVPEPKAKKSSFQRAESAPSESVHKENIAKERRTAYANAGHRIEYQVQGIDGPKSYKFGFDTGKGENRHFRYEESDKNGKVKGHYGYMDDEGKLRVIKYEADPLTGFHAGPVDISDIHY